MTTNSALLFDFGGTHLRCACLAKNGSLGAVTKERIRSFLDGLTSAEIWSELLEKIGNYVDQSEGLVGKSAPVVISFPGPLHENGRIVNAPTITGLDCEIPDLRKELSQRTGRETYLLNDVSAAALYLAKGSQWNRFIVVTISSGIGSKVCFRNFDGFSLFDKGPYAGEIGHITVDHSANALVCDCGGKGHLGAISSGRGIERLARRYAAIDPESFARSFCHSKFGATSETLNNEEHIVPAIRAGDEWSLRVLREGTKPLAEILTNVILALGLQGIFVIGGFAFGAGDIYLDMLRELIEGRIDYAAFRFSPEMVRFGDMCDEACLRGAAEYAAMVRNGSL